MTPEMNWRNSDIENVRPICMFNASNDDEFKEAFRWKSTQPFLKQDHEQRVNKYKLLKNTLQFIKFFHFLKLIEK